MPKQNHDKVVSAQTLYPGPLGEAEFELTKAKGDSVSTGAYRPARVAAAAEPQFPSTYVDPGEEVRSRGRSRWSLSSGRHGASRQGDVAAKGRDHGWGRQPRPYHEYDRLA